LQSGHTKKLCEFLQYAKPDTPDPDVCVEVGDTIGVVDIEFSTLQAGSPAVVHELAAIPTVYTEGKWVDGAAQFHMVVKSTVSAAVAKLCPGLRGDATRSIHNFRHLFDGLVHFIKENKIKWLKAHNGIPADFLHLFYSARRHELDFFGELSNSGLLGFIDPGRIIPLHKITSLQHKKTGKDGSTNYSGYLANDMLFRLSNESKGMGECGFTPHRALDDAKAERNWLTKLPELTQALYGDNPRLECGVSLQKFRSYAEQYEKRKQFLKGKD
jgi:hypothetical protein